MKLKWDQGLASRGKLKGKKSFAAAEPAGESVSDVNPPRRVGNVRWASDLDSARARKRSKHDHDAPSMKEDQVVVIQPIRSLHQPSRAYTLASISPQIPTLSISPSAPVPRILFEADNARLFNHYLNHVAKVTVVSDTAYNPFKRIILPMSFESPLIMSNILAIAAANLSNTMTGFELTSFDHLSNAYTELQERLADPATALSEVTLAGVLGQVSYQLHHGDVHNWRVHLTAARGIVNALGGPSAVLRDKPHYKFYIQHLAWLDTLAATTSSTKRVGKSDYWDALLSSIAAEKGSTNAYSMRDLMGCPEEILQILAEMTRRFDEASPDAKFTELEDDCNHNNHDHDTTHPDDNDHGDDDNGGEEQKQTTRDELGIEYGARLDLLAPSSAPTTPSTALHEIFRLATKIYLTYRILHSRCWSTNLQTLLRSSLDLLERIPARSQEEMALPWPLFIMGSICVYAREQRIVDARYATMTAYMGFGNISRCRELLNDVWRGWREAEERSCPKRLLGQPWDERELGRKRWETVMLEKGYDLLLA